MSNAPTLLIGFPRCADPSLLDLGFGLVGTWGSAIYAFGANVLIVDAPGEADAHRARLQGRMTVLARDEARAQSPDASMFVKLDAAHPYPRIHIRLEASAKQWVYERSIGGDALRLVHGCEALVNEIADALGLDAHPVHWRELFAPAVTPREALDTLEQLGALALQNRASDERPATAALQLH